MPKVFYGTHEDNPNLRFCRSEQYNWEFDTRNGDFVRWGKELKDDPSMSPVGPEILDIEVSTVCSQGCPWCYKSNTCVGKNMSFETFKNIFDKIPQNLTQIAFGIGDIDANPDLFNMFRYCRKRDVIPNVTINGHRIDSLYLDLLADLCGAVAVSHYASDTICLRTIKALRERGLQQVNIHKLLAEETYSECMRLIDLISQLPEQEKPRAIVFLLLKPKGNRNSFHSISSLDKYKQLVQFATDKHVMFGMDSCSAPLVLKSTEDTNLVNPISVEPCESTLFSLYINVDGDVFPCSFAEGVKEWKEGISMIKASDFLKDVWYNTKIVSWREKLLQSTSDCYGCKYKTGCRSCPIYSQITPCKQQYLVQTGW